MDDYKVLNMDRLLGPQGVEQLIEVMTDVATAHQRDGVATDARGFVRSKVTVQIEVATDARTGHIRAEVAVRGGLAKLVGMVRPMVMRDGALLIESDDDDEVAQVRLPELEDPGLAGRRELAAERRREKVIDVGERRRRGSVDEDRDEDLDEEEPAGLRAVSG